nr:peptidylprolyl isomerase [uncultured Methanolobus sp.]
MLLTSGCTDSDSSRAVQAGDTISVNYTGMLEDGTVFDTSEMDIAEANGIYNPLRGYEPLTFVAGAGQMIDGFDEAVIGMQVGEKKTITLPPEKAYGDVRGDAIINFSVDDFAAANMTPVMGQKITSQGYQGTIVNITDANVTVDFNHHLAGKTLIFDIELVSIEDPQNT